MSQERDRVYNNGERKRMSTNGRLAFMAGCLAFASATLIAYGINGLANSDQVPQPNNAIVETVPILQQPLLPVEPIVTEGEPEVVVLQPMPEAQEIVDAIPSDLADTNIDAIHDGGISWPFTEVETVGFVRDFFGMMGKGLSELEKIFGIPAIIASIPKVIFNFYNRKSKITAVSSLATEPIKNALAINAIAQNPNLYGDYLNNYLAFGAGTLELVRWGWMYLKTVLKKNGDDWLEKFIARTFDSGYGFFQSVHSPEAAVINVIEFGADQIPFNKIGKAIWGLLKK